MRTILSLAALTLTASPIMAHHRTQARYDLSNVSSLKNTPGRCTDDSNITIPSRNDTMTVSCSSLETITFEHNENSAHVQLMFLDPATQQYFTLAGYVTRDTGLVIERAYLISGHPIPASGTCDIDDAKNITCRGIINSAGTVYVRFEPNE